MLKKLLLISLVAIASISYATTFKISSPDGIYHLHFKNNSDTITYASSPAEKACVDGKVISGFPHKLGAKDQAVNAIVYVPNDKRVIGCIIGYWGGSVGSTNYRSCSAEISSFTSYPNLTITISGVGCSIERADSKTGIINLVIN